MSEQVREPASEQRKDAYVTPDLVVHGSVSALTQGTAQGVPDSASPGSTLPPP
jgi:hypothetical protein